MDTMHTLNLEEMGSFNYTKVTVNEVLYAHSFFHLEKSSPGTINVQYKICIYRRSNDILLKTIQEVFVIRTSVSHLKTYIPQANVVQLQDNGQQSSREFEKDESDIRIKYFMYFRREENSVLFGIDCEVYSECEEDLRINQLFTLNI